MRRRVVPDHLRQKITAACEVCRKRKAKCDGEFPCAYCQQHNLPCSFKTNRLRRGPRHRQVSVQGIDCPTETVRENTREVAQNLEPPAARAIPAVSHHQRSNTDVSTPSNSSSPLSATEHVDAHIQGTIRVRELCAEQFAGVSFDLGG